MRCSCRRFVLSDARALYRDGNGVPHARQVCGGYMPLPRPPPTSIPSDGRRPSAETSLDFLVTLLALAAGVALGWFVRGAP